MQRLKTPIFYQTVSSPNALAPRKSVPIVRPALGKERLNPLCESQKRFSAPEPLTISLPDLPDYNKAEAMKKGIKKHRSAKDASNFVVDYLRSDEKRQPEEYDNQILKLSERLSEINQMDVATDSFLIC